MRASSCVPPRDANAPADSARRGHMAHHRRPQEETGRTMCARIPSSHYAPSSPLRLRASYSALCTLDKFSAVCTKEAEPLIHMSFCPDKPILAGFLESFAPCSVSALAGRHNDGHLICLTCYTVNTPHSALQSEQIML